MCALAIALLNHVVVRPFFLLFLQRTTAQSCSSPIQGSERRRKRAGRDKAGEERREERKGRTIMRRDR